MLYWTGNWVTFLDSLLQTALLAERGDSLRLPTRVRYLRIDPIKHLEHIIEKGISVIKSLVSKLIFPHAKEWDCSLKPKNLR